MSRNKKNPGSATRTALSCFRGCNSLHNYAVIGFMFCDTYFNTIRGHSFPLPSHVCYKGHGTGNPQPLMSQHAGGAPQPLNFIPAPTQQNAPPVGFTFPPTPPQSPYCPPPNQYGPPGPQFGPRGPQHGFQHHGPPPQMGFQMPPPQGFQSGVGVQRPPGVQQQGPFMNQQPRPLMQQRNQVRPMGVVPPVQQQQQGKRARCFDKCSRYNYSGLFWG